MEIGHILTLIVLILIVVYYVVNKIRPMRLEGGYNTLGKVGYKIDNALGIKNREIVGVKYLGVVDSKAKRGGLGGAALGGFLFGPMGAAIGMFAPKGSKQLFRFAVRYDDGKVKMMDCAKGSALYNSLMSYVTWDDL